MPQVRDSSGTCRKTPRAVHTPVVGMDDVDLPVSQPSGAGGEAPLDLGQLLALSLSVQYRKWTTENLVGKPALNKRLRQRARVMQHNVCFDGPGLQFFYEQEG